MKIKLILLVLSSLLIAAAVSASPVPQKASGRNQVLAEGEPPLTRAVVDDVAGFFEWLFESRFTAAQKGELEQILVNTWSAGDRKEIEAAVQFGAFNSKVAAAAEEKRNSVRAQLLPEVLKGVMAESSDFSRLLLSVYEQGRGGQSTSDEGDAEPTQGDAGGILGSWRSSQLGMISYQNTITGSSRPGRGLTVQYKFLPGGRYEYNGYMETTVYNCTTTLFNLVTGTYSVEGSRLILKPQTSKWRQTNNCAASMNKEQPGKLVEETLKWETRVEQGGPALCLTSESGNEVCYRREQ